MKNPLIAVIDDIITVDNLNSITLNLLGRSLKMLTLDLDRSVIKGKKVTLTIKPLSIALGRTASDDVSFSNQIPMKVHSITKGEILSSVELLYADYALESIIATSALNRMKLNVSEDVVAFIRASEISIDQVLS